jgi:hypothetical protein
MTERHFGIELAPYQILLPSMTAPLHPEPTIRKLILILEKTVSL